MCHGWVGAERDFSSFCSWLYFLIRLKASPYVLKTVLEENNESSTTIILSHGMPGAIAQAVEGLIQESVAVTKLTQVLEVDQLLGSLENWLSTTTTELRLLNEQINFTLKVVEDQ